MENSTIVIEKVPQEREILPTSTNSKEVVDSLFLCKNYTNGSRVFVPVLDIDTSPEHLVYYYQQKDDNGEIYFAEINSLTKWARRNKRPDKSKASLQEKHKLIRVFVVNIILMVFGMSFGWFTFIAGITSLLIGIWLYTYIDFFSWNDKPMFRAMISMALIGFLVNIPMYILLVAFFPDTNAGLIDWTLAWWLEVQIPTTYPFFIVYLVLSSILMTKMWRFHGRYAFHGKHVFSVAHSGNTDFYV